MRSAVLPRSESEQKRSTMHVVDVGLHSRCSTECPPELPESIARGGGCFWAATHGGCRRAVRGAPDLRCPSARFDSPLVNRQSHRSKLGRSRAWWQCRWPL